MSTNSGRFAVKLLNPSIMARPEALDNFRRAEELEAQLEQTEIPILPALRFGGKKMQQIDGQYCYLFNWFDGRALKSSEVTQAHCRTIAAQLAKIHGINRRHATYEYSDASTDWDHLAALLTEREPELGGLVAQNLEMLHETEARAASAFADLPPVTAICHNDMDCKNVLWNGNDCRIIDLECLGWANPYIELYETALCWSGIEECCVDHNRFDAFIRAYEDAGGTLPERWPSIHDANCGRLGWLAYNLRRAAGMDCSEEEVTVGISEVRKTLAQLVYYQQLRTQLT